MSEIEINGRKYRIGRIAAMRQLYIMKRIAPPMVSVLGVATIKSVAEGDEVDVLGLIDRMEPFLMAIQRLPDADMEYVTDNCLAVVDRAVENDRGWQKVTMYPDELDPMLILRLTFEALRENLAGFFAAFQQMYPNLLATQEETSPQ